MTSSQFVLFHKTKSCTCFIHILQCSATDSPILAITRLLLTELSSNLGSTFLAAATGSWGWCSASLLSRGPGPGAGDSTADVWLVMELLGPIMGSIRPEISQFLVLFVSRDFIQQHQWNMWKWEMSSPGNSVQTGGNWVNRQTVSRQSLKHSFSF